ncbi:MAG: methionine--tRNA ligase [Candidatus Aenigmarchaeota archaeon]|nr:methionine--tRNA ligase [Candidatus Aenigmarchaeota archaeon]
MKDLKKFYITTAIPYVNAAPHIGHALEFIQTDAIARWKKISGIGTFLATGSDENSLKNVQAAEKEGITPPELCVRNAEKFRQFMDKIGLSYNTFLRSSLPDEHFRGVQEMWKLCDKAGDIYKKKYKGMYCVGCEAFYTESELENGLCREHKKEPEIVEEENYFFRLSKYQKRLEKLIENDELRIVPESRKNEVMSFIRSGLEDFSVSRSVKRAKGWGVPVPGDPSQIMYVWFDALNVYQTAVGYGKDAKSYNKWWPADVHVIGKGIIRFHAVYWPAMLLSAGLKLPKLLFVHGYITVEGEKMSKSLGNVVDPFMLVEKYGADALRYFMLREIPPFDDGDFSEKALVERINSELVSNFSNLFYRITSFIENNFDGKVPSPKNGKDEEAVEKVFEDKRAGFEEFMDNFRFNEALETVMSLCSEVNKYFQHKKPWENPESSGAIIHFAVNRLKDLCILLYPFIPFAAVKGLESLGASLDSKDMGKDSVKKGVEIKPQKLFVTVEHLHDKKAGGIGIKLINTKDIIEMKNGMLPIKEFGKVELKIGTVEDVKNHPNADKLYILTVKLGNEKRQIVSGIRNFYKPEELKGMQVAIITNLEPASIRGVESQGMLLAAGDEAAILSPVRKVRDGERVR